MSMQIPPVISLSLPSGPEPRRGPDSGIDSDEVAPEKLLAQAADFGVFPAVFNRLRALGLTASLGVESKWLRRFRVNYAHNVGLQQEETQLLAQLAEAGLPCRPIKGVRLTEMLYPDLSWREVVDIDLLLPPHAVAPAYQELKRLGLQDAKYPWDPPALSRQLAQPSHAFPELVLVARHGVLVELHWDWVAEAFPAGDPADDLEAFLVYLCRHAGKHFWRRLQWVSDIELYLRKFGERLDWTRFWVLAKGCGAERSCAASFELCSMLFHRPLGRPETAVARRGGRALARRAVQELLQQGEWRWWHHPAWRLLRVYNWPQRISRLRKWLAPPPWHWIHPPGAPVSNAGVWFRRYRRLAFQLAARVLPSAKWRHRLVRAADLSWRDWWSLAEAFTTLLVVTVAARTVSFDRLQRRAMTIRDGPARRLDETREMIRRTVWLVAVAANHHPIRMRCLARSVALVWMLARRGCATELKLGVRREEERLEAHAWVEWRGEAVNDSPASHDRFAPLEPVRGRLHG
ncbi:MAG: lasso peptide biosynthesis B2 protein [Acidobacteria bacterium]|nr:lasso peptide biosynthesis B2 protein [Acidobacteriota bacterium]